MDGQSGERLDFTESPRRSIVDAVAGSFAECRRACILKTIGERSARVSVVRLFTESPVPQKAALILSFHKLVCIAFGWPTIQEIRTRFNQWKGAIERSCVFGGFSHGLGERLFERVGEHLQQKGLRLSTGTIVDATILNAPSSTKNARQERDPEMHQTRKGKQW